MESAGQEFEQSAVRRACLCTMGSGPHLDRLKWLGQLKAGDWNQPLHSHVRVKDKQCQLKRSGQILINNTPLQ